MGLPVVPGDTREQTLALKLFIEEALGMCTISWLVDELAVVSRLVRWTNPFLNSFSHRSRFAGVILTPDVVC